jgi:hypothetical protein
MPSGQCSRLVPSRRRRNQQWSASYWKSVAVDNVGRLAKICNQLRNLCRNGTFKRTEHTTIMEYLGKRAERFQKNGRLQGEEMEDIISELKGAEGGDMTREMEDSPRVAERTAVHETITEGLLQPQGLPLNTKQEGIFRLLCEIPNGFNNRITGNWMLDKLAYKG